MKSITSRSNPHYRRLLRLIEKASERRQSGLMVLDGPHLVQAYLAALGNQGLELFVRESAAERAEIQALREAAGQAAIFLSDRLFDAASPVATPSGILALAPIPVARRVEEADGLLVLIDGLQDPGNLGSILRSAAAAGASGAWVSASSTDPWSPKCLRGGMGAHFHLSIRDRVELRSAVEETALRVLVADSVSGESVYDADLSGRIAIVIGAEGRGVSRELMAAAHTRIRIPMRPGIDSLNAAAAAAVLFFEWRRRRTH